MGEEPVVPPLTPLPGVGHRLDLVDDDGCPVVVVRTRDGGLQVHAESGDFVLGAVHAAALGSLASGRVVVSPELLERTGRLLGGLALDWVTVPPGAAAAGRSIEDLAFRRRTGTTIVAILRGQLPIIDPDPDQVIEAGDELVIACTPEDRPAIVRFIADGR